MRKVWKLFCLDVRHATMNVIAGIVCIGLIIVPSLYAWFNIAGSWDPYANTRNVKVAVANTDEGYTSDLMPMDINVGEKVTSALRENDQIGWVITDKDDAMGGLEAGTYYAAIIIPPDFSRNLLGVLDDDAAKPTLEFYSNEKENAIANVVTDKASGALREQIDTTFVETVGRIGTSALGSLSDYLDSDAISSLAQRLRASVGTTADSLDRTASDARAYASLVGSASSLLSGAQGLLDTTAPEGASIPQALSQAASGVRSADDALGSADSAIEDALSGSADSLDAVSAKIDAAFADAGDKTQTVADGLDAAAGTAQERKEAVDALVEGFTAQRDQLQSIRDALDQAASSDGSITEPERAALAAVDRAIAAAERALSSLSSVSQTLGDLGGSLTATASDLRQGATDAAGAKERLDGIVGQAKDAVKGADTTYGDTLGRSLASLASAVDGASADASAVQGSLDDSMESLSAVSGQAASDLSSIRSELSGAADDLAASVSDLRDLQGRIDAALASGDMDQLRRILGGDPATLAAFLSAPVELERDAVYPVANNGSAMAPFYTTLALWVGSLILVVIVKVQPSERELAEVGGARLWQAYFGRMGVFVLLALLQAALVCAGDLFYLQIQCVHPGLMFLACFACAFVDVNIMYALTVSFGDVGKAIAVFLLVIQVAGSGGTFPPQMLPGPFQAAYPFLPFVQAIQLMRGAVAGVYGMDYLWHMLALLAFIVPSVVLGLFLRRPLIRLNEWMEHQLASTKVM